MERNVILPSYIQCTSNFIQSTGYCFPKLLTHIMLDPTNLHRVKPDYHLNQIKTAFNTIRME